MKNLVPVLFKRSKLRFQKHCSGGLLNPNKHYYVLTATGQDGKAVMNVLNKEKEHRYAAA